MLSLNVELRLKILWHFKNADTHNYIYIYINTFLWFNISPTTDGYEKCHNMSKSNINVAIYQDKL